MYISQLSISNFKSFHRADVKLRRFNVLIGANAAGKSNLLQLFKFIRDISNFGLENAISLQGGNEYLRNINLKRGNNVVGLGIKFEILKEYGLKRQTKIGILEAKLKNFYYSFKIKLNLRNNTYKVIKDDLTAGLHILGHRENEETFDYGYANLSINLAKDSYVTNFKSKLKKVEVNELFPILPDMQKFLNDRIHQSLVIESPLIYMFPFEKIANFLKNITIYDFDTRLPKKATQFLGKSELEENGENLAIVLRKILSNQEKKRTLFNLVNNVLPLIENIEVKSVLDKYLQFSIQESFTEGQSIPSSMISDGTIFIIALIIAIYYENKQLAIFEEPERRIHPYLISKIIDMMRDAASNKQIIISTHNPEAVKHADIENLLLISRDERGFSTISRPAEIEQIKVFLKNEIGIEELYVNNLLKL